MAGLALPQGDGFAWVTAEADPARAIRRHLVEHRHLPTDRIRAAAYWRRGAVGVHEVVKD